jgi:hypothetical protein
MDITWKPDVYLSLGENCLGAFILKHFNLRKCSYLFDWASCEQFKILPDILSNDLEHHVLHNIINNDNINTLEKYPFGEGDRSKIIYIHHPDKEYQKRVSNRFFNELHTSQNVLFLYTYGRNNLSINDTNFDNLVNIIQTRYPNINFKLLILHYTGQGSEFNLVRKTKIITKYEYKTTTMPPWISIEIDKCEVFRQVMEEFIT